MTPGDATWAENRAGRRGPWSRAESAGLLLVLVLATLLRLNVNDFGVDGLAFPRNDEVHYLERVVEFLHGDWDTTYFVNPTLYMYVLFAAVAVVGAVARAIGVYGSWEELRLDVTLDPTFATLVGRWLNVGLSVASVALMFVIGRRLRSPAVGLVAAAALALDRVHVQRTSVVGNEVPLVLAVLVLFLLLLEYLERPTARRHALCGLTVGLAAAVKYNAGIHLVTLAAASLLAARDAPGPRPLPRRLLAPRFLAGFPCAGLGFALGSPFALVNFGAFWERFTWQASLLREGYGGRQDLGWTYYVERFGEQNAGLPFAVVCGLGLLWAVYRAVARRDRGAALLLAASVPTYLVLGSGIFSQMRFLLAAIPFVLLLGACGLVDLVAAVTRRLPTARHALAGLATVALLAPHAVALRRWQLGNLRGDDRGVLVEWMQEHLDHDVTYVLASTNPLCEFFPHLPADHPLLTTDLGEPARARLARFRERALTTVPLRGLLVRSPDLDAFRRKLADGGLTQVLVSTRTPRPLAAQGDRARQLERLLRDAQGYRSACSYWDEAVALLVGELELVGSKLTPDGREVVALLRAPAGWR